MSDAKLIAILAGCGALVLIVTQVLLGSWLGFSMASGFVAVLSLVAFLSRDRGEPPSDSDSGGDWTGADTAIGFGLMGS